ncbi:MAG TPA: VWA domain-containing protein, partial [Acidimicrobiales bacterium]
MSFSASVYQNEFLPDGASEVNAVVTVTGEDAASGPSTTEKAVVLIVDTSGSMDVPGTKIRAARRAASTAIRLLPDGTLFALVAGTEHGTLAYPPEGGLVAADDRTRHEGASAANSLRAGGGTAMSTWLDRTTELLQSHPEAIRLAYLLTDGINQSETRDDLDGGIARAAGVYQCDTRGVGADWDVAELRHIASGLLGEVDIIKEPDLMDDDFQAFLERALGKSVADVRLRMWTPKGSTVRFVRQVAPTVEDITAKAAPVNALTNDYPTGAWSGDETRDYHVCVDVVPAAVGDERLAARISLMVG